MGGGRDPGKGEGGRREVERGGEQGRGRRGSVIMPPFGFLSSHRVKMHVLPHLCRNLRKLKCFELPVARREHDMLPQP